MSKNFPPAAICQEITSNTQEDEIKTAPKLPFLKIKRNFPHIEQDSFFAQRLDFLDSNRQQCKKLGYAIYRLFDAQKISVDLYTDYQLALQLAKDLPSDQEAFSFILFHCLLALRNREGVTALSSKEIAHFSAFFNALVKLGAELSTLEQEIKPFLAPMEYSVSYFEVLTTRGLYQKLVDLELLTPEQDYFSGVQESKEAFKIEKARLLLDQKEKDPYYLSPELPTNLLLQDFYHPALVKKLVQEEVRYLLNHTTVSRKEVYLSDSERKILGLPLLSQDPVSKKKTTTSSKKTIVSSVASTTSSQVRDFFAESDTLTQADARELSVSAQEYLESSTLLEAKDFTSANLRLLDELFFATLYQELVLHYFFAPQQELLESSSDLALLLMDYSFIKGVSSFLPANLVPEATLASLGGLFSNAPRLALPLYDAHLSPHYLPVPTLPASGVEGLSCSAFGTRAYAPARRAFMSKIQWNLACNYFLDPAQRAGTVFTYTYLCQEPEDALYQCLNQGKERYSEIPFLEMVDFREDKWQKAFAINKAPAPLLTFPLPLYVKNIQAFPLVRELVKELTKRDPESVAALTTLATLAKEEQALNQASEAEASSLVKRLSTDPAYQVVQQRIESLEAQLASFNYSAFAIPELLQSPLVAELAKEPLAPFTSGAFNFPLTESYSLPIHYEKETNILFHLLGRIREDLFSTQEKEATHPQFFKEAQELAFLSLVADTKAEGFALQQQRLVASPYHFLLKTLFDFVTFGGEKHPFTKQETAIAASLPRDFSCIIGGPGTGKTTTVFKILLVKVFLFLIFNQEQEKLKVKLPTISLAAPTGKASEHLSASILAKAQALAQDFARYQESKEEGTSLPPALQKFYVLEQNLNTLKPLLLEYFLPSEHGELASLMQVYLGNSLQAIKLAQGKTIHGTFAISSYNYQGKFRGANHPSDILIIDEVGMVDLDIFETVLESIKLNSTLILLGDKDQLPAIGSGYVLGNISQQAQGYSASQYPYFTFLGLEEKLYQDAKEPTYPKINNFALAFGDYVHRLTKSFRYDKLEDLKTYVEAVNHNQHHGQTLYQVLSSSTRQTKAKNSEAEINFYCYNYGFYNYHFLRGQALLALTGKSSFYQLPDEGKEVAEATIASLTSSLLAEPAFKAKDLKKYDYRKLLPKAFKDAYKKAKFSFSYLPEQASSYTLEAMHKNLFRRSVKLPWSISKEWYDLEKGASSNEAKGEDQQALSSLELCNLQEKILEVSRAAQAYLKPFSFKFPSQAQPRMLADFAQAMVLEFAKELYQPLATLFTTFQALPIEELRGKTLGEQALALLEESFAFIREHKIICPLRKGGLGVDTLNEKFKDNFNQDFYPIMVTENNHELNLVNGDIGIVVTIPRSDTETTQSQEKSSSYKEVYFYKNGKLVSCSLEQIRYELAFFTTIHKAQGDEFAHTVVVLPLELNSFISQAMYYTAITRVKEKLTIFAPSAFLDKDSFVSDARHTSLVFDWNIYLENILDYQGLIEELVVEINN